MDNHLSTPSDEQQREALHADIEACRLLCTQHRAGLQAAEHMLERTSDALDDFLAHARARLEAMARRISHIDSQLEGAGHAVLAALDSAQSAARQLASSFAERIQALSQELGTLADVLHASTERAGAATANFLVEARAASPTLDAHLERVGAGVTSTMAIVEAELAADSTRQAQGASDQVAALATALDASLAQLRAFAEGLHAASLETMLARTRQDCERAALDLKAKLSNSAVSFASVRAQHISQFMHDVAATYDAVSGAVTALSQGVAGLSSTVVEVKEAVELTQTGLQLVAGILARTKHLLESVSPLD